MGMFCLYTLQRCVCILSGEIMKIQECVGGASIHHRVKFFVNMCFLLSADYSTFSSPYNAANLYIIIAIRSTLS